MRQHRAGHRGLCSHGHLRALCLSAPAIVGDGMLQLSTMWRRRRRQQQRQRLLKGGRGREEIHRRWPKLPTVLVPVPVPVPVPMPRVAHELGLGWVGKQQRRSGAGELFSVGSGL